MFAFGAVVVRVGMLQTVDAARYTALGESQRVRAVVLPAERGTIFDRNGAELALTVPKKTVWADPRLVTDPPQAASLLAPILGTDPAALAARLGRTADFVYVARQIDDSSAQRVAGLHLPGVFLIDEPGRVSPSGELARSIVGRVDIDSQGVSGVEGEYDERLAGVPGRLVRERDAQGRTIPVGRQSVEPAQPGDDVVLTIDRSLQFATEQALLRQVAAVGARGARAIIQDPRTGDVLAMANVDIDPDTGQPVVSSANEALTAVFEPGSVNKVITASAAIEEGLVNPDTVLQVPDRLQVSDHLFSDHDPHPVASWSVTDIVTRSSNIGTIMIAQMLGKDRIDEYLRRFGLGDKTALEFPGESSGLMLDPKDWSGTSIGSIPIGQGISVTAMQMLEVYNVIANGGMYVAPRLVAATIDGGGARHDSPPAEQRRVVSAETAAKVNGMLQNVVASKDGTGFRGCGARLLGLRQDRYRSQAERQRHPRVQDRRLRLVLRGLPAGREPPGLDHRRHRRAVDIDLRERRVCAGVRGAREPRGPPAADRPRGRASGGSDRRDSRRRRGHGSHARGHRRRRAGARADHVLVVPSASPSSTTP